ncbi:efflux RND transporter periplasmic adaptor subunit [Paenibacillus tuaregi]|uniref:efflux RND transporter periplasmic adaptor subunit n=1 Tax=Paenibacillus tuaregi TaxID=1816681 RepID=UPI000838FF2B|nr:efflux RND transporter periplasmic adaptor subunit [Paenibacillus tuaregi]
MNETMNRKIKLKRVIAAACLVLAVTAVAAGCSSPEPASTPAATAERMVKVEPIGKHSMGPPREQVADVNAAVQVGLVAQAAGAVTEILKSNGSTVSKGEVIARIYPGAAAVSVSSAEAAVKSAERALQTARSELASSKAQLERTIATYERQLKEAARANNEDLYNTAKDSLESSKQQLTYLASKSSVPAAESQLQNARVSLEQAKETLATYSIKAPSSGTLAELELVPGTAVSPGTKIGTILDTKRMSIKAELSEEAAGLVRGKKVLSLYYADKPSEARRIKVDYIAKVPSSTTRLYTLQLTADNQDGFFTPGSRVQVQLTTEEEEQSVSVPSSSIVREGTDAYILILEGEIVHKRKITLGRIQDIYQEVLKGAAVGEKLVISGQHMLKDGDKVTLQKK